MLALFIWNDYPTNIYKQVVFLFLEVLNHNQGCRSLGGSEYNQGCRSLGGTEHNEGCKGLGGTEHNKGCRSLGVV